MKDLAVWFIVSLLIYGTYLQFKDYPTQVVLASPTTTTPEDSNLANINSGCPDYWRFNKDGLAQRCTTLSSSGVKLRTEELLQRYGLNNYNEREVIGRLHNINTEVLVCIAYADTSLGKYMKSNNNIGNVGNNDRGDTINYSSILKGIDAIGRVLNNKYLGQREEVRQLAGSTNPDGPNYATELTNGYRSNNWIVNIQNCLSLLNNKKVDGGYPIKRMR